MKKEGSDLLRHRRVVAVAHDIDRSWNAIIPIQGTLLRAGDKIRRRATGVRYDDRAVLNVNMVVGALNNDLGTTIMAVMSGLHVDMIMGTFDDDLGSVMVVAFGLNIDMVVRAFDDDLWYMVVVMSVLDVDVIVRTLDHDLSCVVVMMSTLAIDVLIEASDGGSNTMTSSKERAGETTVILRSDVVIRAFDDYLLVMLERSEVDTLVATLDDDGVAVLKGSAETEMSLSGVGEIEINPS